MSDIARILMDNEKRLRQTETREVTPIYLPWAQRVLNPFPLASSGGVWGDTAQPWANRPIRFDLEVLVNTTNNGTNFWTLVLSTVTTGGAVNTVATLTTSAIAANTPARLSTTTITLPGATDVWFQLTPTATLAPGAIYIFPALALLRIGN